MDKTFLSAHDNLQFYTLSSADKITIQVAVQYSAHIGFAPSLNMTRFFLEVSLSQICFVALCSCYTFCQILLAPYLYFNVIFRDLRYLFEEEDGSIVIDLAGDYYGEIDFQMQYKDVKGDTFDWLYIDFQTLSLYASECGFKAELVKEGKHYDYLVKLSIA